MGAWVFSELQLTLIALAALFVFAVWAYNKWQEYRQHRLARKIFSGEHGDALAPDLAAREEPSGGVEARIEPVIAAIEEGGEEGSEEVAEPPLQWADPGMACLVPLRPREELAAPVFWQAQAQRLEQNAKRLRWLAWHDGHWRQLDAHDGGACSRFLAVLQLADRSGPLGEVELARLLAGLDQLGSAIGAEVDLPASAAVLAQAQQLDEFCASVDWRLSLNLVGRGGAVAGPAWRELLQAEALEEEDGALFAVDASGQRLFALAGLGGLPLDLSGQVAGISLVLDVPLVADGAAAFDRLLALARTLATAQDAQLVDDQRKPLSDEALATIRGKIVEFQEKLRACEIPAGGHRALRLYA